MAASADRGSVPMVLVRGMLMMIAGRTRVSKELLLTSFDE